VLSEDGTSAVQVWVDEVVQGTPEYPFSGVMFDDDEPHTNPDLCTGRPLSVITQKLRRNPVKYG